MGQKPGPSEQLHLCVSCFISAWSSPPVNVRPCWSPSFWRSSIIASPGVAHFNSAWPAWPNLLSWPVVGKSVECKGFFYEFLASSIVVAMNLERWEPQHLGFESEKVRPRQSNASRPSSGAVQSVQSYASKGRKGLAHLIFLNLGHLRPPSISFIIEGCRIQAGAHEKAERCGNPLVMKILHAVGSQKSQQVAWFEMSPQHFSSRWRSLCLVWNCLRRSFPRRSKPTECRLNSRPRADCFWHAFSHWSFALNWFWL